MRIRELLVCVMLLSSLMVFLPGDVKAATKTWNASANDDWSNANAWSPTGVPAHGDAVVFDTTSTYNCNIDGNTNNLTSFLMDTGYTGTVSLNANTLSVNYTADGSDFTGTQGTFNGGSGTVNVSGDISVSSVDFTLTYGTSTFDHTGTGTIYGRNDDQNSFYNLKVATAGKTTTIGAGTYPRVTNGQLTIGTGTLQRTSGTTPIYMYGNNANPLVNNGGTISLVQLSFQNSVAINIPSETNYYHIGIQNNNGATLQGDITLSEELYIARGNPTFVDTANFAITTKELRVGASTYANYIDCGSSTIDVGTNGVFVPVANSYILGDTSTWTVAGPWTSVSTSALWDMGTSTVTFDGGDQTIDANGDAFYFVNLTGTGKKTIIGDMGARAITRLAGTTFQIGKDTPDASVTLTLDDAQYLGNPPGFTDGWSHVHGGSLITTGTVAYPMTITSAGTPPTYYWDGPWYEQSTGEISLRNTTIEYSIAFGLGESITNIISNTTFYYSSATGSFATVIFEPISGNVYRDINVSDFQATGSETAVLVWTSTDYTIIHNLTVYANSASYDIGIDYGSAGQVAEFIDSNFDITKLRTWAGYASAWVSKDHNDVANSYKLGCRAGFNFSKSYINNDFGSSDTVEIRTGTLTMDEDGDATSVFVLSSTELEVNTGYTLDISGNLTVNGTMESEGTITDSGNYFDFYNTNPGGIWLNNSTVSKAKLAYWNGGFNFSLGIESNSTINDWTLESPVDAQFNVTYYDFSNKGSGVIWHLNATASSGSVYFGTDNLTASERYDSYVDTVLYREHTADAGDWVNFSYNGWSTRHIYLTWVTGVPPGPEPPGPGQYDSWIVGFKYSKNFFTNEVRFTAVFNYDHNASWYIWDFDGVIYESASPNITRTFQFAFYSTEDVKLTVIATDGNRYWAESPIVLDNSLWVALLCLTLISLGAVTIMRTRSARTKTELIMVETEGR